MKKIETNLVFVAVVLAGISLSCSMFGGTNSNVANNAIPANTNANTAAVSNNNDVPMLAAPKLVEMLMTDTAGLNARLKDKEIIVIGLLKDTMNGLQLDGGPLRTIYCTMVAGGSDEKFHKLNSRSYSAPKPIVEVKGVFTNGTVQTSGAREVSIFIDKCTIVSIK